MKTSLNNTRWIEQYLEGKAGPVSKLLIRTRLLLNPQLRRDIYFQHKTYTLVKMYHHKKVKEELEELHRQIFSDPSKSQFQQRILNLFNL